MANEISNANAPSVVDGDGNPVEDATIIAVKQEDVAALSQSQATEIQALAKLTDVNGDFTFSESELYNDQNQYVVVALEESGEQRGTPNYPHVDASGSALPDSTVWQVNTQKVSGVSDGDVITTVSDNVGSANITGSGTYRANGINGYASVELNGTDDDWDASPGTYGPWTLFAVGEANVAQLHDFIGDQADSRPGLYIFDDGEGYILADDGGETAASVGSGDVSLTVPFVATIRVDDTATNEYLLRINGIESAGSGTYADIADIHLGSRASNDDRYWDGFWGFAELHDGSPSNGLTTREQEIADLWDISLV